MTGDMLRAIHAALDTSDPRPTVTRESEFVERLARAGFAVVPIEPTEAMILAGDIAINRPDGTIAPGWAAMLAAATAPRP